jgi:hypothetical protein
MSVSAPNKLSQPAGSRTPTLSPTEGFNNVLAQGMPSSTALVKPAPTIDPKIINALNRAYYKSAPPPHLAPLPAAAKATPTAWLKPTGVLAFIAGIVAAELSLYSAH